MGNTGVGMLLGDTSVKAFWLVFIGIVILGVAIWYGMRRTGNLSRGERAQLDRNTEAAQRRDDPQKTPASRGPSQQT
jgi:hypothetical protein